MEISSFWKKLHNTEDIVTHSAIRGDLIHRDKNTWIIALKWDELHGHWGNLLWSLWGQLALCLSGSTLPGDSKSGDFQGSLKSELIGKVLRVTTHCPSKPFSLICPFLSPQCLSSSYLFSLFVYQGSSTPHLSEGPVLAYGGCKRIKHGHCQQW